MVIKTNPSFHKEEIFELYQSVGWSTYTDSLETLMNGLAKSFVLAEYQGQKLIGLVRGVTDQQTILYVQDILVNPAYQRQGIGQGLLQGLLTHFNHIGQVTLLTDDEEKTKLFYQSLGFKTTEDSYAKCFVLDRRY